MNIPPNIPLASRLLVPVAGLLLIATSAIAADLPKISLKVISSIKLPSPGYSVAMNRDGSRIAIGVDKAVVVHNREGSLRLTLPLTTGQVRALAWSPEGKLLAVGSYQSVQLFMWEDDAEGAPKLIPVKSLPGHRGYVVDLAWSPDGKRIVSACDDEAARVFDVESGERSLMLVDHAYAVTSAEWSPAGEWLLTSAGDESRAFKAGEVFLRDANTGEVVRKFEGHERPVLKAVFTTDGKFVVTGGLDEKCYVFNTTNGTPLGFYGGHSRPVRDLVTAVSSSPGIDVAFSGAGGRNQGKNEIRAWTVDSGDELAIDETHSAPVTGLALSSSAGLLASVSRDRTAQIFQVTGLQSASVPSSAATSPPTKVTTPQRKWPPAPQSPE